MMDFEDSAVRLARDQSKMRGRRKGGGIAISAKAKQQAEYQKKQQARLRAARERKKQNEAYQRQYLRECQRSLKEKSLAAGPDAENSSSSSSSSLLLKPTSIHGNGDKIALPTSVLQTLTSQASSLNDDNSMSTGGGNPWTFRIGIKNPNYEFPASPLIQALKSPAIDEDDDEDDDNMSDDDEEQNQEQQNKPYLDELGHIYLAYTHCTVVEFTQEEGHVGIPRHIAQALLDPKNQHAAIATNSGADIPKTITIDPASPTGADEEAMQVDETEEQTPGHLAWGAFEIPDVQLEITMVQLPKGIGCTLVPTEDAVKNNFYGLKDVKLVLEQSLIRTRATLSTGDIVSTWHRGTKFDLNVTKVIPSTFQAVTCINTDIEVEIGETKAKTDIAQEESSNTEKTPTPSEATNEKNGFRLGSGNRSTSSSSQAKESLQASQIHASSVSLLPEPPIDQKEGVCTVQIRYSGGHGKRRFAIETAQVKDLFAFAASLMKRNEQTFRLVTRFPRRELSLVNTDNSGIISTSEDESNSNNYQQQLRAELILNEAGLQRGQEMFIVEDL